MFGGFLLIDTFADCKIIAIEKAGVIVVDLLGVIGNKAVLLLAEYLIEHRHGDQPTVDQLTEHITCSDTLQLVCVAYQQYLRVRPDAGKELSRKPHIHHGRFIHDDKACVQHILFTFPEAAILTKQFQQAVQRAGIVYAGTLRHAAACPAGGGCQQDLLRWLQQLEHLNDRFQDGRLTSTGRAGNDGQITAEHHVNSFRLPQREFNA